MRRALAAVLAAMALAPGEPAHARGATSGSEPALCVEAARAAARRHGIPHGVMEAITLVETRRRVGGVARPWPWTLNVEGEGAWFATRAEALGRAMREIARGRRSIDLGCFQLNWRWHGENFATPDAMLDPALSADHAARFLAGLHAETGDWMRAIGHYHSRTPVHAARYRGLIGRALARLGAGTGAETATMAEAPGPSGGAARAGRSAARGAAPAPPARPGDGSRNNGDDGAPLIMLASGGASDPAGARAPGGVALRVFARASPFGFGGRGRPR